MYTFSSSVVIVMWALVISENRHFNSYVTENPVLSFIDFRFSTNWKKKFRTWVNLSYGISSFLTEKKDDQDKNPTGNEQLQAFINGSKRFRLQ